MQPTITKSEVNHKWSATLTKRLGCSTEVRTLDLVKACGLEGEQVTTIINQIYPHLPNKSIKARTQAVQAILLNLLRASIETKRTGQLTGFLHLRTNTAAKLPKRYAVNSFSNTTLTKVLDDMLLHGLVDCYSGFRGKDHLHGLASLWLPTTAFSAQIESWNIADLKVIWFNAEIELVELKDLSDTLIDYTDSQHTFSIRQAVSNTNELRLAHDWHYIPETPLKTQQNALHDLISGQTYRTIAPRELICQRKFKHDFSTGGRFYAPYQQLSKAERATITIDGKSTVEMDIKSAQPRILYNLRGLESPVDCYQIDGMPRETVKQMMLVALNAKDKEEAVRSLCVDLKMKRNDVLAYLDKLIQLHAPIADSFFSSAWRIVQYQDGELTNDILKAALAQGIAVLPVHDSYIVDATKREQMLGIIKTAYRQRFGFECVVEG
ncbi:MAG: hypothetical protein ACK4GU_01255 [Alishewanella aestuarii]